MKKRLLSIAQIIITLVLLFYLSRKVNLSEAFVIMKQANIYLLILSGILCFIFILISNWRWKILLDARDLKFSFGYLLKIYFASWFFNNILPTAIGGDVLRVAYTVKQDAVSGRRITSPALAAAFVDRFIGFIGLFFFALLASVIFFLFKIGKNQYLLIDLLGFIILVIILLAAFSDQAHQFFSKIFSHIKIFNLGERFERAYTEIKEYRQVKAQLLCSFLLSLLVQLSIALVWFFIGVAISAPGSVLYYFLYIPVLGVVTMVPISVGGLGIRENGFVYMFNTFAGILKEKATAISGLYLIINLIFALIGGIVFLFIKRETQTPMK